MALGREKEEGGREGKGGIAVLPPLVKRRSKKVSFYFRGIYIPFLCGRVFARACDTREGRKKGSSFFPFLR